MGTQKWSEIRKLSKATEADRAEARAELAAELGGAVPPPVAPCPPGASCPDDSPNPGGPTTHPTGAK